MSTEVKGKQARARSARVTMMMSAAAQTGGKRGRLQIQHPGFHVRTVTDSGYLVPAASLATFAGSSYGSTLRMDSSFGNISFYPKRIRLGEMSACNPVILDSVFNICRPVLNCDIHDGQRLQRSVKGQSETFKEPFKSRVAFFCWAAPRQRWRKPNQSLITTSSSPSQL